MGRRPINPKAAELSKKFEAAYKAKVKEFIEEWDSDKDMAEELATDYFFGDEDPEVIAGMFLAYNRNDPEKALKAYVITADEEGLWYLHEEAVELLQSMIPPTSKKTITH